MRLLPVIIYNNVEIEKLQILSANKGKTSIYMWTHIEGKRYVGSAVDTSKRLLHYFSTKYLDKNKNMSICRALKEHGYGAFSLSILEYIDIRDLSKEDARNLILGREQYFLDSLSPEYNLLKIAGSSMGFKHSEESLAKLSKAMKGENNPRGMLGKTHSAEAKAKVGKANKGRLPSGVHPTLRWGRLLNIPRTEEDKAKMSKALGTTIYVYSSDGLTLINKLSSAIKAGEFFNSSHHTILTYARNGKLFKDKWILSIILK